MIVGHVAQDMPDLAQKVYNQRKETHLYVFDLQICGHHAVLVGDAAHAVTSVLGQGCNTALSTCTALDRALSAGDINNTEQLDQALEQYNAEWLPQAHALQQLEYMSVSHCTASSVRRASTILICGALPVTWSGK